MDLTSECPPDALRVRVALRTGGAFVLIPNPIPVVEQPAQKEASAVQQESQI